MADDTRHRREFVVSFRVTAREAAHLDAAGRSLSTPRNRADFARAAALYHARQKVPPPARGIRRPARRLPTLDIQQLGALLGHVGKLGANLNQLARVANTKGCVPTIEVLDRISAEVTTLRAKLAAVLRGGEAPEDGHDH